jgi:hypothetical protein
MVLKTRALLTIDEASGLETTAEPLQGFPRLPDLAIRRERMIDRES